jgi:hypothetical protein
MAAPTTNVRIKLSDSEKTLAYIMGGGITLLIAGALLGATRGSAEGLGALFFFGVLILVGGFVVWLMALRPWKNFDDWSTPLYTGHEHEEVHEEHPVETTEHAAH